MDKCCDPGLARNLLEAIKFLENAIHHERCQSKDPTFLADLEQECRQAARLWCQAQQEMKMSLQRKLQEAGLENFARAVALNDYSILCL